MPSKEALPQMSLLLLVDGSRVLLGRKKRGFGKGKLTGIGGKREEGESIEETVIREVVEEVCITPLKPERVATLNFFFSHEPSWSQQVCVYTADAWQGDPSETEEIVPAWFDSALLPYAEMWSDAPHWLPRVLAGEKFEADFYFTPALEIDTFTIRES